MNKKLAIIGVSAFLAIGIIVFLFYMKGVNDYRTKVSNIQVGQINMADIPDGNYVGECDVDYIYAKVEVNVKDGRMVSVKLLEHRHDRGAAAEQIVDDMVAEQKIDVDTVSGATNSSKVIQAAAENALKSP